MAFMFSRAAWADLKGKNAARLTMLLNFPMFSTLSSTWNTHTGTVTSKSDEDIHPESKQTNERKAAPGGAACRSPPPP